MHTTQVKCCMWYCRLWTGDLWVCLCMCVCRNTGECYWCVLLVATQCDSRIDSLVQYRVARFNFRPKDRDLSPYRLELGWACCTRGTPIHETRYLAGSKISSRPQHKWQRDHCVLNGLCLDNGFSRDNLSMRRSCFKCLEFIPLIWI